MSTTSSQRRREARRGRESARRRLEAIEGAARVFAGKGYHGAQMSEVADEAGLSLAALYSMFKGKEELYQEVICNRTEAIRTSLRAVIEPIEDPVERLLRLIDALFEAFEEHQDLLRVAMSGTRGLPWRIRSRLGRPTQKIIDSFTAWVIGLCEAARDAGQLRNFDPETFASALIGTVLIRATRAIERPSGGGISEAAAAVRAIFSELLVST